MNRQSHALTTPEARHTLYSVRIPSLGTSGYFLMLPMLWADLKDLHCGLPRASVRREASCPSGSLQDARALEGGDRTVEGLPITL